MLFDTGAIHSFTSLVFSNNFNVSKGDLGQPLEVKLDDDRKVRASSVYCGRILKIYNAKLSIYLIPIPMCEINIVVGMDWLTNFRALIDCKRVLVRVQTPSGRELTISIDSSRSSTTFCAATKAMMYFQHGCMVFLAYVVNT